MQDLGSRGRVRRRARRRHQRGHQVRRQHLQRFAVRALLVQAGCARTTASSQRLQIDPITQNSAYDRPGRRPEFNRNEFGGTIGGPIVRDQLVLLRIGVSRVFENLTQELHLGDGEVGAGRRANARRRAMFGKVTLRRPSTACSSTCPALCTPDKADGHHRRLRRRRREPDHATNRRTSSARQTLGYEIPQWNMAYTGDYTATDKTLVSVRGGYMKDNYFDTGVNKSQTFEYVTPPLRCRRRCSRGARAVRRRPAGFSNLPRTQINDHDITTRNFVDLSVTPDGQRRRPAPVQGRLRLSRTPPTTCELAYPNNGYVTRVLESARSSATSRAWARAAAPTATTRSTTSARSARPAPTS